MIRTATYPRKAAEGRAAPPPADKYRDKLIKYIPAEAIAFYVPAFATAKDLGKGPQWAVWIVAALGGLAYLYVRADSENPPRWYFYALSVLAFFGWSVGTSPAGDLFGIPEGYGPFTITLTVFVIPLIDELLTKLFPKPGQ